MRRTALVGLGEAGASRPAICVELMPEARWDQVEPTLRALAAEHTVTRGIDTFLHHRGAFPVDVRHNSKIFREKLAVWAAGTA